MLKNRYKGGFYIYKSCKHCGKIHEDNFKCRKKPVYKKKAIESVKFRNSPKWQKKRTQIKKRDCYLCQICIRDLYSTIRKYNYQDLEVHHAVPIEQNENTSLESNNLITLCNYHHRLCDSGKISIEEVKRIINEQENTQNVD